MMPSSPLSPQQGDVVIARDVERGNAYTISVVPGDPQVRYSTYEEALAVVTTWALRQALAVWFTEDGTTFTALELMGPGTAASRTPRPPQHGK